MPQVGERDSGWEDPDITGADILQVIDWAQRQAGDRPTYAVAVSRDDTDRERHVGWCGWSAWMETTPPRSGRLSQKSNGGCSIAGSTRRVSRRLIEPQDEQREPVQASEYVDFVHAKQLREERDCLIRVSDVQENRRDFSRLVGKTSVQF